MAVAKASCFPCTPAMLGNALPVGGFVWHEVQFVWVRGEPAWWQTVQSGALEGDVPLTAWHMEQVLSKVAWPAVVCSDAVKGTE